MLNIILNGIGILLILYSVLTIKRDLSKEKSSIKDLDEIQERVKEYYNLTEEIIENFDEIIDSKIEILNKDSKEIKELQPYTKDSNMNNLVYDNNTNVDSINFVPLYKKVLELNSIGLTKEEIAKRLNKGVREVEIILKMHSTKR